MSKRRDYHLKRKVTLIYVLMIIGLILVLVGGFYLVLSSDAVNVVRKEYAISIPNRYYGEIILSPEGGQRLVSEAILEIHNITIERGMLRTIASFNTNKTYLFVTARVIGNSSDSPINMVLYLSDVNGTKIGGAQYINRTNVIESENILVFSQLPQGNYKLEILSNTDMFIRSITLRGIYYKDIRYPIISLELRPEQFQHHELYYIDKIDFKGLWISIFIMMLGFTVIVTSFMIYIAINIQK